MQRYAYTGGDPVNHVDPTGDYGCTLGPDCVGSAAQGTDGSCSYVCNNVTQVNQGQQVTTTQAAQNRRYYSGASSAPAPMTPLEAETLATIAAQTAATQAAAAADLARQIAAQQALQAQNESASLAATQKAPSTYTVLPSVPIGPVNNPQGQAYQQRENSDEQYCSSDLGSASGPCRYGFPGEGGYSGTFAAIQAAEIGGTLVYGANLAAAGGETALALGLGATGAGAFVVGGLLFVGAWWGWGPFGGLHSQ